jgi:hypothetical protein
VITSPLLEKSIFGWSQVNPEEVTLSARKNSWGTSIPLISSGIGLFGNVTVT